MPEFFVLSEIISRAYTAHYSLQ